MPPPSSEVDPNAHLDSNPKDATFDDWRVIKELTERSVLSMELKDITDVGINDLQRYSMTVVHQVPSFSFISSFGFSFYLSVDCNFYVGTQFFG